MLRIKLIKEDLKSDNHGLKSIAQRALVDLIHKEFGGKK